MSEEQQQRTAPARPTVAVETCSSLFDAGLAICPCCESCHDDADSWGIPLMEGRLRDGRSYSACCRVRNELNDRGLLEEQW